nr:MAG: replication associated protein [Cressdnaviricota sp.]
MAEETWEELSASLIDGVQAINAGDEGILTEAPPKEKKFRMQCKNFFLTFPMCQTTKEVALGRIKDKFPGVKALVCHELHQSGDDHLHVLLLFETKKHVTSSSYFDFIGGQHGKYEPARSIRNSVEYITKKGDYISEGIAVDEILKKQSPKSDKIAKMLSEGKSLDDVESEERGFFLMNKRKIEEYESYVQVKKAKEGLKPWVEFTPEQIEGMNSSSKEIAIWLNENIQKPRKFKQAQLYIYGARNLGKTTLIEWLRSFVCVYSMPRLEEFYDSYNEDFHSLVVLDEFKAHKSVEFLNSWLEGSTLPYRKKGSQGQKNKNLPMIVLSNYSLEQCYPKMAEMGRLDTLECRLQIVHIDERLNLFSL